AARSATPPRRASARARRHGRLQIRQRRGGNAYRSSAFFDHARAFQPCYLSAIEGARVMKRAPLYSRSQRPSRASAPAPSPAPPEAQTAAPQRRGATRRERWLWARRGALLELSLVVGQAALHSSQRTTPREAIDGALRQALEQAPRP